MNPPGGVESRQAASQPRAVVHKFDGSSLANAAAVRRAAAILAREAASPCYVVVSAAFGVTDDLFACLRLAAMGEDWRRRLAPVRRRQLRLANVLAPAGRVQATLTKDFRRIRRLLAAVEALGTIPREAEDAVVAHGEPWSMRLFAAVLEAQGLTTMALDARRFLRVRRLAERVEVDWVGSKKRFAAEQATCGAGIIVVPGFIAACADRGITLTLGRNGSDWSATILARLADAAAVTIWGEVPGIFDADPAVVNEATVQSRLGFETARTLAARGARVLHPATLEPLEGLDADLRIKCTFTPEAAGTAIVRHRQSAPAMIAAVGNTVSAVGGDVRPTLALAALGNARLPFLTGHFSPGSIEVQAGTGDAARIQRIWHRRLCRRRHRVDIFLIGTGKVGTAFLKALSGRSEAELRLLGATNSSASLCAEQGIEPQRVRRLLNKARERSGPEALGQFLLSRCEAAPVIVDATASAEIAAWHPRWLERGIHVVTANKQAAAAGWITANQRERAFYGDAATVGAGVPVLTAIRRLRIAGDRVESVEALLSGSLAYLFHALQLGRSFSFALATARRLGYTEPDPRVDLGGEDVARKLAIIAEAAGIACTIAVPVPVLLPGMLEADEETFRRGLPALDAALKRDAEAARAQNGVLRYVASLSANGNNSIGVCSVPRNGALAQTRGAENIVVIRSSAYAREPLVIRGPGAGPLVTARALLADIGTVLERYG